MIDRDALQRMSEPDLRSWLLRRMRGDEADPPISKVHMEGPDDFVAVVHGQSAAGEGFRDRLERSILWALDEVGGRDLRSGPDANALKNLAELADRRELVNARASLQRIAEQGIFGGHAGVIEPDAEEAVLFALAGLQQPKVLWKAWEALWQRNLPELSGVAATALRISNPDRAVTMLSEIVRRALSPASLPLGEILWSFAKDPNLDSEQIKKELERLKDSEVQACRRALVEVGANDDELREWLPTSPARKYPPWVTKYTNLPTQPPRLFFPP